MKLFLDTASLKDVKKYCEIFPITGVTTNPSLIAKEGVAYDKRILEIQKVDKHFQSISVELVESSYDLILREHEAYRKLLVEGFTNSPITFKLPMTEAGIRACRTISRQGSQVNMTLIFSLSQAVLAVQAGAHYVSPFVGRIDDIGYDGIQIVNDIQQYIDMSGHSTEVIAASARTLGHVNDCAKIGVDIITLPPHLLDKMLTHPLSISGLAAFEKDYEEAGLKTV